MRIDVGSGGNIAVPQPLLDLPQAHAVGKQETGAAMPIRYNCDNTEKPSKLKGWRTFVRSFSIHFWGAKSAEKGVPKNKMLYMRQHF